MSSRWECIVRSAREIDESFAEGRAPDFALVAGLAHSVLDFQRYLAAMRLAPFKPPTAPRTEQSSASDEPGSSAA